MASPKKSKKAKQNVQECECCRTVRARRAYQFEDGTEIIICLRCEAYIARTEIATREAALGIRDPMSVVDTTHTTSSEVEANRPDWHKQVYGGG